MTEAAIKISEEKKAFFSSSGFIPRVDSSKLSPENMKALYFATTAATTFVAKEITFTPSYNEVHKIEQKSTGPTAYKPNRAPFWSRRMCRYQESYVPLPLEGAAINRELARTFRPVASNQRLDAVKLEGQTRYCEDYQIPSKPGRAESQKPKQQKHVKDDDHLLVLRPASHDHYPPYSGDQLKPPESFKPPLDKPTNASAGYTFNAHTRYSEDFGGSNVGSQLSAPKATHEDNSSRVWGNSIPNKVRNFMFRHDACSPEAIRHGLPPITAIMRAKQGDDESLLSMSNLRPCSAAKNGKGESSSFSRKNERGTSASEADLRKYANGETDTQPANSTGMIRSATTCALR
jgi:hypothetical protein